MQAGHIWDHPTHGQLAVLRVDELTTQSWAALEPSPAADWHIAWVAPYADGVWDGRTEARIADGSAFPLTFRWPTCSEPQVEGWFG